MASGLNFLLAARRCEIGELEELAKTSELLGVLGRFTHELQRERGASNVYLGSQGGRFAAQRLEQIAQCERAAGEVRASFDRLDTDPSRVRNGARLFSRIAAVLHAMDALPALRERIAAQQLSPREATDAFVKLVAGLLAVVFEAADSATDPEVSRALVAMFNFMQGKEFAGQERAFGSLVFTSAGNDAAGQQHWRNLIDLQQGCLRVFQEFADPAALLANLSSQDPQVMADLERLRRLGCTPGRLDPDLSQAWFDCCTERIDAMRVVEAQLAANLRHLCGRRIEQARAELRDHQATLESLVRESSPAGPAHYGPHLERSVMALVQEQTLRLQAMSDELDTVRATLNERKIIERAKGLLMAHRHLSEQEAYKTLRQTAMNQNKRVLDVAEAVLAMADVLPAPAR